MTQGLRIASVMTVRAAGLAALVVGGLYWAGYALPLHLHMALGGLVVVALFALVGLAAAQSLVPLAVVGGLIGLAVPGIGMAQLYVLDARAFVQVAHVVVALAALGWGERMAARLKASATSRPAP